MSNEFPNRIHHTVWHFIIIIINNHTNILKYKYTTQMISKGGWQMPCITLQSTTQKGANKEVQSPSFLQMCRCNTVTVSLFIMNIELVVLKGNEMFPIPEQFNSQNKDHQWRYTAPNIIICLDQIWILLTKSVTLIWRGISHVALIRWHNSHWEDHNFHPLQCFRKEEVMWVPSRETRKDKPLQYEEKQIASAWSRHRCDRSWWQLWCPEN